MEGSSGGGDRTLQQVNFESELSLLKRQIDGLQVTVHSMQHDTEKKDKAIAALARDKEQLAIDLKRQRRSNANLKQQLEDERRFYYKEKEQYCNEMNSYKKLKRQEAAAGGGSGGGGDHKKELSHLKNTLNQTLEANYNLSVKFLRMKSCKSSLKNRLASLEQVHERTLKECKADFEKLQNELNEIVRRQFAKPIPPSSKKYLQIIKQNGALIHDNLCLQLEIDRLHLALDRMRVHELKTETNSKLQFIHNGRKTTTTTCFKKPSQSGGDCSESKLTTSSTTTSSREERKLAQVQEEDDLQQQHLSPRSAKYELMTVSNSSVSENTYYTSVKCCQQPSMGAVAAAASVAYRTQSAPEIVRTNSDKTN